MPYFLKLVLEEENSTFWFGILLIIILVSSILSIPVLVWLQSRFDKKTVLFWVTLWAGILNCVGTFVPMTRTLVACFSLLVGLVLAATQIIPDALLGDIIDYDE